MRFRTEEKLAELAADGSDDAFDALFARHRARLSAFCEHALGSTDAADAALPEIRSAARVAVHHCPAHEARARLYRAARERCRRPAIALSGGVAGLRLLPEPERSALLVRELTDLTYDELAVALEESVPSVKLLLVRARIGLADLAVAA